MRLHIVLISLILLFCMESASAAKKQWKQGAVIVTVDVDPPDNRVHEFLQSHSYEIGNGTDIYCSRGDEYHAPDCSTPPLPHNETSYWLMGAIVEVEDGPISLDLFPAIYEESDLALFVRKWEAERERQSNAFPSCTSGPCSFKFKGVFLYELGKRHKNGIQDLTIEFSDEFGTYRFHANYQVPQSVGLKSR